MKKLLIFSFLLFPAFSSVASSVKCSEKATNIYFSKLMTYDSTLSALRGDNPSKLSETEIKIINDLISFCERGVTDKDYNTEKLRDMMHKDFASNGSMSNEGAKKFADALVSMYEYGVTINK
ncbi:hypothetical protein GWJ07_12855 [Proteus sp. G2639]|nr:hypothetical protein [Proteus vulgaris]NBN60502.1 hypothetical protein [Proteus sp. G2639]HEK0725530.1 hypothetical protein [Proteus mirabilis]